MHCLSRLISFSLIGLASVCAFAVEPGQVSEPIVSISEQDIPESGIVDSSENGRGLFGPHDKATCYTGADSDNSNAKDFYLGRSEELSVDSVTIEADYAEYYEDGRLELDGDVEILRQDYRAYSDSASIDQTTNRASLVGDIQINGPSIQMRGDSAIMNMTENASSVSNAHFLNPVTRLRGSAKEIRQSDVNQVVIEDGLFTTCEPDDRSWSFKASEIILNQQEGYGTAKHTRFQILDTPVLYVPWFSFPIDDRRKTGFLYPTMGSSNTGSGFFISTPYYLNIAPQFDATLTPTYIAGRSLHTELELRHLSTITDSEVGFGYIKRDDHYLAQQLAKGFDSESGERWGMSIEQDIDFAPWSVQGETSWYGSINYSDVSDNDYLEDLNQGLRIDNQDSLDRRGRMTFSEDNWQLDMLVQAHKHLDDTLAKNEYAYQRLPEINYQSFLYHDALALDWQSQYVYFYRDPDSLEGDDKTHGSRIRHTPKLSLPWEQSWGYLKPSVSLDHTDYFLEDYSPQDNHVSRTIPIYELDTGLYFDRDARHFGHRYRHSLEPRLYYAYTRSVNQDNIPNFDSSIPSFEFYRLFESNRFSGGDRVGDNNRLTAGFTTRWTDWDSGLDRLVVSLAQVYHNDDRVVGIDGLGASTRSDSLLATEVLYRPWPQLEFGVSGFWDARLNQTQEGLTRVSYRAKDGGPVLNVSHRYRRQELEQTDTSIIFPMTNDISVLGRWRYDLDDQRTIGSLLGMEYTSCCWRVQLLSQNYLTDESTIDNTILFRFQLMGLGGFGADEESLDDQIPGYKAREEYFN